MAIDRYEAETVASRMHQPGVTHDPPPSDPLPANISTAALLGGRQHHPVRSPAMKNWQLTVATCIASTTAGIVLAALICLWLLTPNPWS